MVVSMRGDVGEWNAAQVPMGRSVPAILDAIGIPHWHRFMTATGNQGSAVGGKYTS
jgi:sulfopyruvate decarboxylase TPP-binding subunit